MAISSLKVGDRVRSLDVKTGKSSARVVTRVHVNHDSDLLDLTVVRNGHRAVLHTTARHPFWSQTRKAWVRADQLATTDRLRTDQVKTDKTGAVRVARVVAVPGDEARWDLTVATDHDYYVLADNTPVLAHNCGDGDAADLVVGRVRGIEASMTSQEAGRTTYAVGHVILSTGRTQLWISSAGRTGYVRPALRGDMINVSRPAADELAGLPHINDAEMHIARAAEAQGAEINAIGATRPVCSWCQQRLGPDAPIVTALKGRQ